LPVDSAAADGLLKKVGILTFLFVIFETIGIDVVFYKIKKISMDNLM